VRYTALDWFFPFNNKKDVVMQFDLILGTQFSFMISLMGMMGGAFYFALIKSTLPVEHQSVAVTSAVYCMMAAVMYGYINYKFGIGTDLLRQGVYPTELRYIDWLITTPLIVNKFPELLGGDDGPAIALLIIVADVMMILFGFAGETSINAAKGATVIGWAMFGVGCLAWLFIIFVLYSSVSQLSTKKLGPVRAGLSRLKLFIVFGWLIYPLGFLITLLSNSPDMRVARELVYNIADLFNKVGFGMVAVFAVQQLRREDDIRQAMQEL
jgi:sensory rhodopsin